MVLHRDSSGNQSMTENCELRGRSTNLLVIPIHGREVRPVIQWPGLGLPENLYFAFARLRPSLAPHFREAGQPVSAARSLLHVLDATAILRSGPRNGARLSVRTKGPIHDCQVCMIISCWGHANRHQRMGALWDRFCLQTILSPSILTTEIYHISAGFTGCKYQLLLSTGTSRRLHPNQKDEVLKSPGPIRQNYFVVP